MPRPVTHHAPQILAALLLLCTSLVPRAATNISGNFISEAQRLEAFSSNPYGSGSNNYVAPTGAEWAQFKTAAQALWTGNAAAAEANAASLDYHLIVFTHTNTATTLLGLRARETNGAPTKPWGTFFVNTNSAATVLIEAPHPQNDLRSPLLAAEIFLKSGARGFLLAGAHRNANGMNTADPGNLTNTIFHAVHEEWSGVNGENTGWQIHGFAIANHPGFPSNTLAVLSTGVDVTNVMSTNIVLLDEQLEWNALKSYAYNDALAATNVLNVLVNEGVAGTNFDGLAATHNVQGKYSRALGGTFVHVELATIVRTNAAMRTRAADAIANAVLLSRTNVLPALAPFSLNFTSPDSDKIQLTVPTQPFRSYMADRRDALDSGNWGPLYAFPGDGAGRTFTNSLTNATGFFRVRAW